MALRCFLFSSDEGTSDVIRQVVTGLGVEGEACSQATTAAEKLTHETFQLLVIDWDQQQEAEMLISAARQRRAADRPLILAIVRDDASVPKALQAGANSILRKPLLLNQVNDTFKTARDLLRSRQESASAAAAGAASASPMAGGLVPQPTVQAGEILRSMADSPSGQIETETELAHFREQSLAQQIDALKDLEPVASAVEEAPSAPSLPTDEPKGLEWYLKTRGVARQPGSVLATSEAPPEDQKAELLGYEQTPSFPSKASAEPPRRIEQVQATAAEESKPQAQLFSYVTEESEETAEPSDSRLGVGKKAIIAALVLAAGATVAAPQAPWHGRLVDLTARGRRALHGWLNPQPVTAVTQAPSTHEDFKRAGDEYKLPVAENIPDATTDPSQITVLPVVDPTKKSAVEASPEQPSASPAGAGAPTDGNQTNPGQAPAIQPTVNTSDPSPPVKVTPAVSAPVDTAAQASTLASTPSLSSPPPTKPSPATPRPQPAPYVPPTTKVPSSLKSQMATMVPDASGNKPVEAAMPTIEPVNVPELTERSLLTDQPPVAYPANAAGKQGTVTLQVLIGRDGTVQDAKFLQGSLAFARAAIDGVKRWKFKPYTMNGRPVSVETNLTLKFAPAQ